MNQNQQETNNLENFLNDYEAPAINSSSETTHDVLAPWDHHHELSNFEFIIEDLFLDHFFP
jgi:hypothetical protein